MISDLDSVLEDCLQRLAQGETLQLCLERYPDHAEELKPMLQAAARLKEYSQVRPSPAFRARTRAKLYAYMDAHPQPRGQQWKRLLFPFSRMAVGLATFLLAFGLTGTAVAQSALPGATFYPWKLASERTFRMVSPDQVGFDLFLAERRVNEAVAVSGNVAAQEVAMYEYQRIVASLETYQDAAVQSRIEQALKIQQEQLKTAGLVPDLETPVPTSIVSPTLTPVPSLDVTSTDLAPTKIVPTAILPTIKVPTVKPPTIKIPTLILPTIKVPTVAPTAINIPTVVLPTIKIPTLALPTIGIPTLDLPDIPGLP